MSYLVYAVAALLLASIALLIKVVFIDKRRQKIGLIFMLLAAPLYLVYYSDRWPKAWGELRMRALARPLKNYAARADVDFVSDVAPAIMVCAILLIQLVVFQRVKIRRRLDRISDPIATFLAGSVAATMFGGTLVSTFHWGWVGAVSIGAGFALIYAGALALVAALVELMAALARLFGVYVKRRVFWVATMITRAASWISALGGRLVSRALLEKIREETALQKGTFEDEQDIQDQRLVEAYVRDRARGGRRVARQRQKPDLPAPTASAPPGDEERLSFTAAYPSAVVPDVWHTLIVALHGPGAGSQAEALLMRRAPELGLDSARSSTTLSTPMRRGTTVTLVPTIDGVDFNPPRVEVVWYEDAQEVTFRMRTAAPVGTGLYGAVEVLVGPMLVGLVPIGFQVAAVGAPAVASGTQRANGFNRVFVSYSHQDADVVRAVTEPLRGLVEVLMDSDNLRSGQDWRESLHQLITDADVFQLCWSSSSAVSSEVEHEWRFAQTLTGKGSGFIRPLYWELPMPSPPAELSNLHFSRVDLERLRPATPDAPTADR